MGRANRSPNAKWTVGHDGVWPSRVTPRMLDRDGSCRKRLLRTHRKPSWPLRHEKFPSRPKTTAPARAQHAEKKPFASGVKSFFRGGEEERIRNLGVSPVSLPPFKTPTPPRGPQPIEWNWTENYSGCLLRALIRVQVVLRRENFSQAEGEWKKDGVERGRDEIYN